VRIVTDDGGVEKRTETKVDKKVSAVIDDKTFVLADVEEPKSKVFVYGKQVDDFRVVDYDQLFSLNIGATQQLAIDNDNLTNENAEIKAENETIKARLAALEQAVEALQGHKDQLQSHE